MTFTRKVLEGYVEPSVLSDSREREVKSNKRPEVDNHQKTCSAEPFQATCAVTEVGEGDAHAVHHGQIEIAQRRLFRGNDPST